MKPNPTWCLLALLLLPALADAGSLRCDDRVIRTGDLAWELECACGAPDARTPLVPRAAGQSGVPGDVVGPAREQWIYDFSPRALPRVVVLEGGTVTRVEKRSRR